MFKTTIIKPPKKINFVDIQEIIKYKELLFTLVERDVKVRYKQTIIGGLWAILVPFATMVLFSFFFGKIAQIPSDNIPYPIFSYSGLLLWTYFSTALGAASNSLISNSGIISKVYFPRIIIPMSATITGLIDYLIASLVVVGLMIYFNFSPNFNILLLPVVVFFTWMLAAGVGFWLSATNVLFRDIKYLVSFILQLWIYATPVIYPLSVAGKFKWLVTLNPMSGLIEAHRAMILGHQAVNFEILAGSIIVTLIIFFTGIIYFKSIEHYFADVI
jgi:homopolymeric O-antigen transport system permease protein